MSAKAKTLSYGPAHFISRELSWLEFNQRVLDQALDRHTPLLERLKFFCIVSSNLDEFFEVRVAGIKQQMESDTVERSMDGLTSTETFKATVERVRQMVEKQYACWREEIEPALRLEGVRFHHYPDVPERHLASAGAVFSHPGPAGNTPLAIDPAHPFPQLLNKSSIHRAPEMTTKGETYIHLAVVQIPRIRRGCSKCRARTSARLCVSQLAHWASLARAVPRHVDLGYSPFGLLATANFMVTQKKGITCSRR